MQGKVEMELAKRLTGRFYCQLVRHGMVDLALNEARSYTFDSEEIAGRWVFPCCSRVSRPASSWQLTPLGSS